MLTLYYISAYNHERNIRARFNVSAETEASARTRVEGELAEDWKITHVKAICATPVDVLEELAP